MPAKTDFRYNINDRLVDEKRDIKIIARKRDRDKSGNLYKYYQYKCLKCGWDCSEHYNPKTNAYVDKLWITQSGLYNRQSGCLCCNGDVVVRNKNSLLHNYPELAKFLVNVEDGYIHTFQSNKKILCKCNICGNQKYYKVNNLVNKGFSCEYCSDNISYSEKILMSVLKQLNLKYTYQFIKHATKRKYMYDFYFSLGDDEFIIETNGIQHYVETKFSYSNTRSLEDEMKNDVEKRMFAINTGIKPENYIVIDARKSDLDFIRENIMKSKLNTILDLSHINWNECGLFASSSLLVAICKDWDICNKNSSTSDLVKKYNLSKYTIIRYLKQGNRIGLCAYDGQKEKEKQYDKMKQYNTHGKPVEIIKDGKSLGIFCNARELMRKSEQLFDIKLNSGNISNACNTHKAYKGFYFNYMHS